MDFRIVVLKGCYSRDISVNALIMLSFFEAFEMRSAVSPVTIS